MLILECVFCSCLLIIFLSSVCVEYNSQTTLMTKILPLDLHLLRRLPYLGFQTGLVTNHKEVPRPRQSALVLVRLDMIALDFNR